MHKLLRLATLGVVPLLIAAQSEKPASADLLAFQSGGKLKQTRVSCGGQKFDDGQFECQSEIPRCYDACDVEYFIVSVACTAMPPPVKVICHAENTNNLGQCYRQCRGV